MLSLYEYIALNNHQRAEILWDKGEFIANSIKEPLSFQLHALYGFYVEIVMEKNEISEITPFKSGERLEKYLKDIDTSDL